MRRREFITLLGGSVFGWQVTARAEQPERMRRIGVLYGVAETDLEGQAWNAAFRKRLAELGWIDGRNVHVEYRWTGGNLDRTKLLADELVRPSPDVLVAVTTPVTAALQRQTHTIPIVFTSVSDPVGSGFVASLRKPGGNITGFINMEVSLGGKWVELLHEIAPQLSHMAILFNPQTAPFARYYLETFRSASRALSVEPIEAPVSPEPASLSCLIPPRWFIAKRSFRSPSATTFQRFTRFVSLSSTVA
jgi:putative ABC transport system substrate-binding protein